MNNLPSVSYLISRYPAISHTFILREILHLKSRGMQIHTASVNATDRPDERLTQEERDEKSLTWYVKRQGVTGAAKAIGHCLLKRPGALLRTFAYCFRLGGTDARQWLYHLFYLVEAAIVARWMDENNSRHLHVHFGSEVATVGLLVKSLNRCRLSIYIHGPDEFYDASKYLLEEKTRVADRIFCISNFARSQMMKLSDYRHWKKYEVCRLGVDTDTFAPAKKTDAKVKTVIAVGRLCPAKGQHILLLAMKQVLDNGQKFRLIIVGDGPDRESLQTLTHALQLDDHVEFTGAVNHDEVHHYYQQADVFCLPSFAEGIPIVLMEAMAQQIPCVTTRITGIPELIDDGVDGLLVAPSSIDELSDALQKLLADDTLRETIGKAARKKVQTNYNIQKNTDYFAERLAAYLERE